MYITVVVDTARLIDAQLVVDATHGLVVKGDSLGTENLHACDT